MKNYKTDAMFPGWGPTLVAMVISFVLGYIVIIGFLKFVSNFSYKAFAISPHRFGCGRRLAADCGRAAGHRSLRGGCGIRRVDRRLNINDAPAGGVSAKLTEGGHWNMPAEPPSVSLREPAPVSGILCI